MDRSPYQLQAYKEAQTLAKGSAKQAQSKKFMPKNLSSLYIDHDYVDCMSLQPLKEHRRVWAHRSAKQIRDATTC